MREMALKLLATIAKRALNVIWDSVWEVLFEAIEYAEEQWEDQSEKKKDYVMDTVMDYIDDEMDFGYFRTKAVEIFMSRLIDGVVERIEEELGEDWVDAVDEYEDELADLLPIIS